MFILIQSHSFIKGYHSLPLMFVFYENAWGWTVLLVPVLSFIFLQEWDLFDGMGWDSMVTRFKKNLVPFYTTEAVFLVMCDPSMNELWAT